MIADGTNDKVWIHDRKTGESAGSIGDNGRMAGQFHWIDAMAIDSQGNLYTGEVDTGKRVQKFVLMNGDSVKRVRAPRVTLNETSLAVARTWYSPVGLPAVGECRCVAGAKLHTPAAGNEADRFAWQGSGR